MMTKEERTGMTVYLKSIKDARRLKEYGDVLYVSNKFRYAVLYVFEKESEQIYRRLSEQPYVKKVLKSVLKDIESDFVGKLFDE